MKKKILTKQKENRGITLIALVITIIVLLILAGITITSLTGEKGIIKEARTAKELSEKAALEEQVELAIIKAEEKHKNPTIDDVIEELKNNKVISKNDQVDKETGDILSDLGYLITGKLDDYISVGDVEVALPGITDTTKNRALSGATSGYNSKNPVIPQGFRPVTTEGGTWTYTNDVVTGWNDGLVITDNSQGIAGAGNEFVWVPCKIETDENTTSELVSYSRKEYVGVSVSKCGDDTSAIPVSDETAQIREYGGFWVARYEAGLEGIQTDNATLGVNNSNKSNPVSKKGTKIWNQIDYTNSYEAANRMINNTTTYGNNKSGLITGKQWDTIMQWYEASGIGVTASATTVNGQSVPAQDWGTHKDTTYSFVGKYFTYTGTASEWSETTSRVTHTANSNNTSTSNPALFHGAGLNSDGYKKNIADLGGNFGEWCAETLYSSYVCHRGGNAQTNLTTCPVSWRWNSSRTGMGYERGFRVVLYVELTAG